MLLSNFVRSAAVRSAVFMIFAAGWIALAGAAQAQSDADRLFQRLDANGDGVITLADLEIVAEKRVARIDLDGDGRITRMEMRTFEKRWSEMRTTAIIAQLDKNGDGVIVLAETTPGAGFVFAIADTNNDGKVTRVELSVYFGKMAERRSVQIFTRFDRDKDGVISRAERSAVNRARFRQLDANGDSKITKAEIAEALNRWLTRQGQAGPREAATPQD